MIVLAAEGSLCSLLPQNVVLLPVLIFPSTAHLNNERDILFFHRQQADQDIFV
jgi:hypothetical protein